MTKQSVSAAGDSPTNEELVQRLQEGDTSAAEELLRQNSGYLTVLAKQYDKTVRGPSLEEDLKQEGALALLKAAEQFDPSMGNRFLTYATPAIQAAMRELMKSGMAVGRAGVGTQTTTLLLAYMGSWLSVMMVYMAQGTPVLNILTSKMIASEIVQTLTGCTGLVLVTPLTALAGGFLHSRR